MAKKEPETYSVPVKVLDQKPEPARRIYVKVIEEKQKPIPVHVKLVEEPAPAKRRTPKTSTEAIERKVEQRFKNVRTVDDIAQLLGKCMRDWDTGKISDKVVSATIKRCEQMLRKTH